jgi:hypothetical protein
VLKKKTDIQQQHNMKKIFFAFLSLLVTTAKAQNTPPDSAVIGKVTVIKDSRLDELVQKEAAFNEALAASAKASKGYRLMILNTNDRPLAMKVRSQLLQNFPEQKVYMGFQPPFIKLKFGNFLTKEDAELYKKDILRLKIITGNVYLLPETIETKPDKNKETTEN